MNHAEKITSNETSEKDDTSNWSLSSSPALRELGQLTRDLHTAIEAFNSQSGEYDSITQNEFIEAKKRLEYIVEKTEDSALKTLNIIDSITGMFDEIDDHVAEINSEWSRIKSSRDTTDVAIYHFSNLLESRLGHISDNSKNFRKKLTSIIIAQDYQDLTGQVVSQVIQFIHRMETRLFNVLKTVENERTGEAKDNGIFSTGPQVTKTDEPDVLASQSEVDDLLSSLGL